MRRQEVARVISVRRRSGRVIYQQPSSRSSAWPAAASVWRDSLIFGQLGGRYSVAQTGPIWTDLDQLRRHQSALHRIVLVASGLPASGTTLAD